MKGTTRTPVTVLASVVSCVFLIVALVFGTVVIGHVDDSSTPIISAVLAIVATTIPSLLALYKAESNQADLHNGVLVGKVKEALVQHETEQYMPFAPPIDYGTEDTAISDVSNIDSKKGE
jgi:uncharacterized protein YacL